MIMLLYYTETGQNWFSSGGPRELVGKQGLGSFQPDSHADDSKNAWVLLYNKAL